jgi:hypothetical protein
MYLHTKKLAFCFSVRRNRDIFNAFFVPKITFSTNVPDGIHSFLNLHSNKKKFTKLIIREIKGQFFSIPGKISASLLGWHFLFPYLNWKTANFKKMSSFCMQSDGCKNNCTA